MFRLAKKAASNSSHEVYKMGAVVVKGSRILATASNKINRGCRYINDKKWSNTLHAEAAAILQLIKHRRLADLVGSDLYVTRVNKTGSAMMAKPCSFCYNLAISVGIRRIFFTDSKGETQCLKL